MIYRSILIALLMTFSLSGCDYASRDKTPKTKTKTLVPILGEFQSKVYQVNTNEHVTVFDIPGYSEPIRCIVWANDKTTHSHMQCTSEPLGTLPESSGLLNR